MSVLKKLQSIRDGVKTVSVDTETMGKVELMTPFASHRFELLKHSKAGNKNFGLVLIAMCLVENGGRLVDSMDLDEVIQMIDVLGSDEKGQKDIETLFTAANKLSKVLSADIEEAEKN